jgi:chromate transport protein ChrA
MGNSTISTEGIAALINEAMIVPGDQSSQFATLTANQKAYWGF